MCRKVSSSMMFLIYLLHPWDFHCYWKMKIQLFPRTEIVQVHMLINVTVSEAFAHSIWQSIIKWSKKESIGISCRLLRSPNYDKHTYVILNFVAICKQKMRFWNFLIAPKYNRFTMGTIIYKMVKWLAYLPKNTLKSFH